MTPLTLALYLVNQPPASPADAGTGETAGNGYGSSTPQPRPGAAISLNPSPSKHARGAAAAGRSGGTWLMSQLSAVSGSVQPSRPASPLRSLGEVTVSARNTGTCTLLVQVPGLQECLECRSDGGVSARKWGTSVAIPRRVTVRASSLETCVADLCVSCTGTFTQFLE